MAQRAERPRATSLRSLAARPTPTRQRQLWLDFATDSPVSAANGFKVSWLLAASSSARILHVGVAATSPPTTLGDIENEPVPLGSSMNVSTVFPEDYPVHHQEQSGEQRPQDPGQEQANGQARQSASRESCQPPPGAKDWVGLDEVTKVGFLVPLFAEALGTCLLVIIGCASCIAWDAAPSVLHIGLTFGLAVASLAHVLGPVSGCHVNPAVTLGLLVSGNCTILKSICYIVCQCCGAVAGSAILKAALPDKASQQGLGMTLLGNNASSGQGVLIEAIVTFLLVLVVHGVTDPKREDCRGWAPMAIGLTISVSHLAVVPLTGSSMNPARSLGPAAIVGLWTDQWIYWVGPIVGGLVAGALYKTSLRAKSKDDEEASYNF
ncbi:aquaporin AQPAn.G-like [Phymastichus coffea]|uniref:aquaporin AQPAn.G-like n=1 Tax=Phymastichus coffea TaxID=108790 RepID=UPI00273CE321|nr:aquaporin AQPAn.G-like [Phymastichus coffea]